LSSPALGTPASGNLANCSFPTLNQNTSGNAATATAPQGGGSFITSSNIGGQSVNYANSAGSAPANGGTSAACSGNAATASNPASGGSFITSSNIGSQSVNYANSAGSAPANGGTSAACSGNSATASNPASGGSFLTSSNYTSYTDITTGVNNIGSYIWATCTISYDIATGGTVAAGNLGVGSLSTYQVANSTNAYWASGGSYISGTWRCMGYSYQFASGYPMSLWVRIA
jgi:hypothetical protein